MASKKDQFKPEYVEIPQYIDSQSREYNGHKISKFWGTVTNLPDQAELGDYCRHGGKMKFLTKNGWL